MQFKDFVGQKEIISVLKKKLAEDKIGHAILFCGPNGQGKKTLALLFAKSILCLERESSKKDGFCGECISCKKVDKFIHPDLLFIAPQGKSIKIEQVRELKKELLFKPGEGDKKIFIMEDVHAMSNEAANSMLNILEEPPEYVVSVLLTSNLSMLLPTILSRCEIYKFSPIPPKDMYEYFKDNINYNVNYIENDINKAVALSGGHLEKAKMFLENDLYKNQEREIIEVFKTFLDKKNRLALFEWAEALAEKTDEELDMFFEIFTLFLRDLFVLKIAQKEELLYGFDNIKEYSKYFSIEDIELIITKTEKAKQYLSSNVNRLLTFEGMLLEIKEVINNE